MVSKVSVANIIVQVTQGMSSAELVRFERALVKNVPVAIINSANEAKDKKPQPSTTKNGA
jgi:hypothetical protein